MQLDMSCLQKLAASPDGSMRVTEACAAQQAPPGSAHETVASIAQQALEHTGCAGVHPAREDGCSPVAPTHVSTAAEGCGEPLNELEERRMAETDEEGDAGQV